MSYCCSPRKLPIQKYLSHVNRAFTVEIGRIITVPISHSQDMSPHVSPRTVISWSAHSRRFMPTRSFTRLATLRLIVVCLSAGVVVNTLSETCRADRASLEKAISQITSYRANHGVAPSMDYYFEIIARSDLTNSEQARIYFEIVEQQRPRISSKDLISILKAKTDSISSFTCEYTVTEDELPATSFVYTFGPSRFLIEESQPATNARKLRTYDGSVVRRLTQKQGSTTGDIQPLTSLTQFFEQDMPLCQAMMFDGDRVTIPAKSLDLAKYIDGYQLVVLEATQKIQGRDCLMLDSLANRIWLDIDRNFALVRHDEYSVTQIETAVKYEPVTTGRWLKQRKDASGLHDHGNGIWLPSEIKIVGYNEDGGTTGQKLISVNQMEINPKLGDKIFSDSIFPPHVGIVDGVRKMLYTSDERASIDGLLREEVSAKKKKTLFLWTNVCVVVLLVCILIARRRRIARQGVQ